MIPTAVIKPHPKIKTGYCGLLRRLEIDDILEMEITVGEEDGDGRSRGVVAPSGKKQKRVGILSIF